MIQRISLLLMVSILLNCGKTEKSKSEHSHGKHKVQKVKAVSKSDNLSNKYGDIVSEDGKSVTVHVEADDRMTFNRREIHVKKGQHITLVLKHTGSMKKEIMGHNFVLLQKNVDLSAFANKAMKSKDNEYIPEGNDVIAFTKLIGGGESDKIQFSAPAKGSYDFICSFPGHFGIMKGKFIVE